MKLSSLSAILFILSTTAYSQHFDPGVIHLLNPENYPAPQAVRCNLLGDSTDKNKTASRDLNDCAMALCGLPSKNPNVFITNKNFQNYVTPELEKSLSKEINPKLDLALKRIKKDRIEEVKNIEKKLLSNGVVKINMKEMDPLFNTSLSDEVFFPYVKKDINMKRPLKERVKVVVTPPPDASVEFKNQLNKYAQDYEKFSKYNSGSVQEYANEKEESVLAKEYFSLVKKSYMEIRKSIPADQRKELDERVKDFDRRDLSLYDVSEFEVGLSNSSAGYKTINTPATCKDEVACQKIFEDYLSSNKNISNILSSLKKDLNDPEVLKQEKLKCNAGIINASSNASNEKNAKAIFAKVKKQMEEKVFSRFSAHSREIIKRNFDNNINANNEKAVSHQTEGDDDSTLRELDIAANENLTQSIGTQEDAYNELVKLQDSGVYDIGMSLCQEGQSVAWDAFMPYKNFEENEILSEAYGGMDQMFVSPFTTLNEKAGRAIVAHELGHAMSYIFQDADMSESSAATYKKIRQCATENYLENTKTDGSEGRNTEEDTADLIAYMTYQNEKEVSLCALLRPSSDEKSYVNLEFLEKNGQDPHSTSLYRAYLEAINKGLPAPVSCQKSFERYADVLRAKKCI
jgi:hypothetical protein